MLMPGLKNIKQLSAGSNHILALDEKGNVFAWGNGQQSQLGRRVVERTRLNGLVPREFGLPRGKVIFISCGSYHSFAIDKTGKVWAWGLNNYGETGISDGMGEDDAVVVKPAVVESLKDYHITQVKGGSHHSLALTDDGDVLAWGRVDGYQTGIKISDLPADDVVFDERKKPRILTKPTKIPSELFFSAVIIWNITNIS